MHILMAIRQIDHQWPKVYQALSKGRVRTRPGLDPLKRNSRALGRLAYDVDTEAGKTTIRADLYGRIILEADAKRAIQRWWDL